MAATGELASPVAVSASWFVNWEIFTGPQARATIMIEIAPEARVPRGALPKRELSAFVREACASIGLHGQVSILLTTSAAMQELNRSFRRKNKPTDVLSFPALDPDFAPAPQRAKAAPALAGDLAISLEIAASQAAEFQHTLLVETKVLLLHGLLHLAGFDHEQDSGQMARHERRLRKQFDLPLGLIQRAGKAAPAAKPKAAKAKGTAR